MNLHPLFVVLTGLVAPSLLACAHTAPPAPSAHAHAHAAAVHWAYDGEAGPAHWGDLKPEYAACATGRSQSPIDLEPQLPTRLVGGLTVSYATTAVTVVNNGHAIQVDVDPGSTLSYGGQSYALKQFHLHAGSEHTLAGRREPLELHLVHAATSGEFAVIAVFLRDGAESAALAGLFAHLPRHEGASEPLAGAALNVADLLPSDRRAWTYTGSLTTPPCTEGVSWIVMAEPVEVSAAQLQAFTAIFDHNYRPVQPLRGRLQGAGGLTSSATLD